MVSVTHTILKNLENSLKFDPWQKPIEETVPSVLLGFPESIKEAKLP